MTDTVDTVNLYGKFVDAKDSLTGKKQELGCFPKMTFKQRMYGWFTCVCLGTLSPTKKNRLSIGHHGIHPHDSAKPKRGSSQVRNILQYRQLPGPLLVIFYSTPPT